MSRDTTKMKKEAATMGLKPRERRSSCLIDCYQLKCPSTQERRRSTRKHSRLEEFPMPPKTEYENTFKLEPDTKFPEKIAKGIIYEVLQLYLQGAKYEPYGDSILCKVMSQEIKERLLALDIKRYKLVVYVTIGEKKEQDVRCVSRCLWNMHQDVSVSASFENQTLYAVGVVFALYYE